MRKKFPYQGKVLWRDADTDTTEFHSLAEVPHRGLIAETHGLIVKDDELGVTLFAERLHDPETPADVRWRGRTFIPRGMVLEIVPTRDVRKRPPKQKTPPRLQGEVPLPFEPPA